MSMICFWNDTRKKRQCVNLQKIVIGFRYHIPIGTIKTQWNQIKGSCHKNCLHIKYTGLPDSVTKLIKLVVKKIHITERSEGKISSERHYEYSNQENYFLVHWLTIFKHFAFIQRIYFVYFIASSFNNFH